MPDSMNPVPSPTPPGLIPSLMAYLRPVVWHDIAGIVCLLLYSYFAIWVPAYVKTVINQIEQGTTRHELLVSCLLILVLAAGAGFMLFLARWLIIGASREFDQALRNDFFAHIQRLSPGFYHRIRTGDLMTRFTSDIEQVRMLVGPGIMYPTQTIFMTTLALYSMFQLDTGLTLTLLAPITFLLLYVNFNTRK
ncbi:MAG TPA: ABC transporter transmembrane domain-containing protein, partial [bacterium]|nr:ABC transporter transmembrane domain-containing protein [bacterium]